MPEDIQAIIDAVRAGVDPTTIAHTDTISYIYIPGHGDHESRIEAVHFEKGSLRPIRKRGYTTVFDAASFNEVLKDNEDAGNVAIYFDRNPEKPSVVAVMNGNGKNGTGWGDYRVEIAFRPTPQWVKWKDYDGKLLGQVAFAEFIEDNVEDIAEPAGATMLEVAQHLSVIRSVNFKSKVTLHSGAFQFQHMQDDTASVGAGDVAIPQNFTLGIAPIFGLPAYKVPARFRYRIEDGKLKLGYKLQRTESIMAQIVEDVITKVERGANVSVMDGLPPAALI